MWEFSGSKCPRPPTDSTALDCWLCPSGAMERFTGTISRFRRRYGGPKVKAKCPLGHKGAPLPNLCLLNNNCAPSGAQFAFRDLNIEENALFLNKKGACFTLKGHFLLRKKGTFHLEKRALLGSWIFLGGAPPPPVPPPLSGMKQLLCVLDQRCRRKWYIALVTKKKKKNYSRRILLCRSSWFDACHTPRRPW